MAEGQEHIEMNMVAAALIGCPPQGHLPSEPAGWATLLRRLLEALKRALTFPLMTTFGFPSNPTGQKSALANNASWAG